MVLLTLWIQFVMSLTCMMPRYNFTGYRSAFSDVPDSEFVHKPHHLFYDANNKEGQHKYSDNGILNMWIFAKGCSWPGIDDNQMREKVVVVHRGTCKFVEKVMAAQQKDALVIFWNKQEMSCVTLGTRPWLSLTQRTHINLSWLVSDEVIFPHMIKIPIQQHRVMSLSFLKYPCSLSSKVTEKN